MKKTRRLTAPHIKSFRETIYSFFQENGRQLPWRFADDPYHVLVSEFMLQQTQVPRVLQKYDPFLAAFPSLGSLAAAPFPEVLSLWQGLGYNRRALALHRTAQRVVADFRGRVPDSVEILRSLPGIGNATAGAISAFAFGKPVVFIETNIRRVFIHFFFPAENRIVDADILPLIGQTLDHEQPRSWYYALMDYGSMLKSAEGNPNRRSAHYSRQSAFENSDRQIRGLILRTLLNRQALTVADLLQSVGRSPDRVEPLIARLIHEGFLIRKGEVLTLAGHKLER